MSELKSLHRVYVSFGSNLGDRIGSIQSALQLIGENAGKIKQISPYYENKPWGFTSPNMFINGCVEFQTTLSPFDLLKELKSAEHALGRMVNQRQGYADRIIDLDLLLFDDLVLQNETLMIPHPQMSRRLFVLRPLCDIAPAVIHPLLKKSIRTLLDECPDMSELRLFLTSNS